MYVYTIKVTARSKSRKIKIALKLKKMILKQKKIRSFEAKKI